MDHRVCFHADFLPFPHPVIVIELAQTSLASARRHFAAPQRAPLMHGSLKLGSGLRSVPSSCRNLEHKPLNTLTFKCFIKVLLPAALSGRAGDTWLTVAPAL